MESSLLKLAEYGQWVLLLGVVVWLVRQMLEVVSQNTAAVQALSVVIAKIVGSVDDHEEKTVAVRTAVTRIDGTTARIENTVSDTNRVVRDMLPLVKRDE